MEPRRKTLDKLAGTRNRPTKWTNDASGSITGEAVKLGDGKHDRFGMRPSPSVRGRPSHGGLASLLVPRTR